MTGIAALLLALLWPLAATAANCEPEAQATERVVRDLGTGTATTERAIGRARSICRQDPPAGRAELDSVRRDARQRPIPPGSSGPGSGTDEGGYHTPILDPAWREGR